MKKTFQYQSLWLRHLFAIPVLLLVYSIQTVVIHPLTLSDTAIMILDVILVIICLSVYYKITEKYRWYIKKGNYSVCNGVLNVELKGKATEINLNDVTEIFMSKNNMFSSHFVLLEIKWAGEKLKLYSAPIAKRVEVYDTEFMSLFKVVKTKTHKLEVVKDLSGKETDYWLKKKVKQS